MALFNRVKSSSVQEIENGLLEARGTFIDSVHEINLTLHVAKHNLEIVMAQADMVRGPNALCIEAQKEAGNLAGIKISAGSRKAVQQAVGHARGCTHLTDLAMDLVKAVVTANFTLGEQGLSREALDERYINLLGGTCNRWTIMAEQKKEKD